MKKLSIGSVSRVEIILEIKGKPQLRCELKRHLAPNTIAKIVRILPIEGNAHVHENSMAYVETAIDVGLERARKEFKKGDVAFLTSNGSICFFFNELVSSKAMSPIGKILSNIELLGELKTGDVFRLTQAA